MTSSVPYFNADEMEHNPFDDNEGAVHTSTILSQEISTNNVAEPNAVITNVSESQATIDTPSPISTLQPTTTHEEEETAITPPSPPPKDENNDNNNNKINDPQSIDKFLPEIKFQSKHHFDVKIIGLERVGTNSNKRENPTIIFQYETNIPLFRRKRCDKIKKTIEEFKEFYKFLNSCVLECFVPTLPLPYTHYGINNQEDYEEVLRIYQIWFNRIVMDPIIICNEEFIFFIESDFNTYRPINHGQGNDDMSLIRYDGIKRKTMKQFQPPYDNNIKLSEFRPLVKSLYRGSQYIQECMLTMDKTRGLVIQEETILGKEFIQLNSMINQFYSNNDNNTTPPYEKYGKILITVGDINSVLCTMNLATLYDGLNWIKTDSYGIKESLTDRHFIMRDLMNLQKQSKIKQERARKNRNKRDIDPLKLNESIHDLQNTIKLEQRTTLKLTRMTMNMEKSREEWLKWYNDWIKTSIKNFTLKNIEYERKKLSVMERAKYGIRSTDSQGGLSRLGRDHLPILSPEDAHKSGTMKPSQQKDNDTWTTTDRHLKDTNDLIKTSATPIAIEPLTTTKPQVQSTLDCNARTAVRFLARANF